MQVRAKFVCVPQLIIHFKCTCVSVMFYYVQLHQVHRILPLQSDKITFVAVNEGFNLRLPVADTAAF